MWKVLVSCILLIFVQGGLIPDDSEDQYIVGGFNASINDFPYIVSMQNKSRHVCGGSVIAPKFILTAAHCCVNQSIADASFRAGSSIVNKSGIVYLPKAFHLHPKFNEDTGEFDVAVVELMTPLNYSKSIQPISIAECEPDMTSPAIVSGWGLLREYGKLPEVLQTVTLPLVDAKTCKGNYEDIITITDKMICAGTVGRSTCQGDSGGPLVQNGRLIGTVSFGVGCAREEYPGVFAKIADARITNFIKQFL